jgi:hypothetical protein
MCYEWEPDKDGVLLTIEQDETSRGTRAASAFIPRDELAAMLGDVERKSPAGPAPDGTPENVARLARACAAVSDTWRKESLWDAERHIGLAGEQLLLAAIQLGWCLHDSTPQRLTFQDGREMDESRAWSCQDCHDLWTDNSTYP